MAQHSPELQANSSKAKEWFWGSVALLLVILFTLRAAETWFVVGGMAVVVVMFGGAWSRTRKVRQEIDNKSWNPWESLPPPPEQ